MNVVDASTTPDALLEPRKLTTLLRRYGWYIAGLAVSGALYYVSAFGFAGLGSPTRYRIILAMLFLQSIGLLLLGALLANLLSDLRSQHTAATQIATIRGLWQALEVGAESGTGLPIEVRRRIYAAGREAFQAHDAILRSERRRP
jgi:hypothetical protein